MKIEITIIDDDGKEYAGIFAIPLKSAVSRIKVKDAKSLNDNYKGLVGGIRYLIDDGFFTNPKTANEVHFELKKELHYHSLQSVDSALRKSFVKNRKLTRIDENKIWKYVIRR